MDFCFISIPNRDNSPPVAVAAVPKGEFSYTENVTLDGSGSSDPDRDPLTCTWREGSSILGTGPVLTRSFAVGRHNVTLTVDDDGSRSSASVSFDVVNRPPVAIITPHRSRTYTTEDSIGLDGRNSVDPENGTLTYEWKEGSRFLGSGPKLSQKFSQGEHTVTLVVADERGAVSQASAKFTVEQKAPGFGAPAMLAAVAFAAALSLAGRRRPGR
jgi:hypothetical protein